MSNEGVNKGRRNLLIGATAGVGAVGAVFAAVPFVKSWKPSEKAKAAGAPVETDYSKLENGQQITVEWRGKPVWVMRRDPEMLKAVTASNDLVADPDSTNEKQQPENCQNEYRSIEPEIFVAIGLCTHLGCSPKLFADPGTVDSSWLGGFFCACHGSKFDLAGRVYKSVPANDNLLIPPYTIDTTNKTVVVGGES